MAAEANRRGGGRGRIKWDEKSGSQGRNRCQWPCNKNIFISSCCSVIKTISILVYLSIFLAVRPAGTNAGGCVI